MSEKTDKSSHKKKTDKLLEGRKYAVISPQSIITLAESCGISGLNEELASKIGEDVTYRLREIIQSCSIHMRSSSERILRSIDVARVLPNCSEMQGYGYLSGGSSDFLYVPQANVFVSESNEIEVNLPQVALDNETYLQKGEQSLKGVWFFPDNSAECTARTIDVSASTSSGESLVDIPALPPHLVAYYSTCAKIILCKRGKVLQKVLENLRTSSKIVLIVPYFLNLLIEWLQELPRGSDACENLLLMLHSLIMNPYIYRDAAVVVNGLITSLLVYAVDPLSSEVACVSKDFEQREIAAEAVAKVMVHWYGCDQTMFFNILQKMEALLFDSCSSVRSHYGALSVLRFLGDSALSQCFWPHLEKYLEFLTRLPASMESLELEGCVLKAAGMLYLQVPSDEDITERDLAVCRTAVCDRLLFTYFGDALCAQWQFPLRALLNEHCSWVHSSDDLYLNSCPKEVKAEVEDLFPSKAERNGRLGCARRVYLSKEGVFTSDPWGHSPDDISMSSVSKDSNGSADNVHSNTQGTNSTTEKRRKEMKDSGGRFCDLFELHPVKKLVITISSIQGLPTWNRILKRRELDSSHQTFCKHSHHKKCLQLNYANKVPNSSQMSSWNVNISDVFNICL